MNVLFVLLPDILRLLFWTHRSGIELRAKKFLPTEAVGILYGKENDGFPIGENG
jgi:hypothetical protein